VTVTGFREFRFLGRPHQHTCFTQDRPNVSRQG